MTDLLAVALLTNDLNPRRMLRAKVVVVEEKAM
jgi:hypothetical protein